MAVMFCAIGEGGEIRRQPRPRECGVGGGGRQARGGVNWLSRKAERRRPPLVVAGCVLDRFDGEGMRLLCV
jgi:hypothetical protein